MRWSWRIARIAGIDVRIHATFGLLLGWIALAEYMARRSWLSAALGVAFTLAVFATIVLHELGHALVARRFGIRTREITLLPIGGIARLERMPERPLHELAVAAAGPAVNGAIGAVLLLLLWLVAAGEPLVSPSLEAGSFFARLMWVNFAIALFNLVPAFPMDGGRMLRALLGIRLPFARATQVAARLGQAIAVVFGLVGLFVSPFLVLVAIFVWMGAAAENAQVQLRAGLEGLPVRDAMETAFATLEPGAPLEHAVELTLDGAQQDFPVVEDGRLVGLLTRGGLLRALAAHPLLAPVSVAMSREVETAGPAEPLNDVILRLQQAAGESMPVLAGGHVVGLLTAENVGELVAIARAIRREAPRPARSMPRFAIGGAR